MVLGILGIPTAICAPIAWVMGSKAKKEIARSGVHYSNEQNINIGRILGIVFSIIYAVSSSCCIWPRSSCSGSPRHAGNATR